MDQAFSSCNCTCNGNCNCDQYHVFHIIRNRRAVRRYKPRAVQPDHLQEMLNAAAMAPSAMNKQPWTFYVLQDIQKIKSYAGEILKVAEVQYHDLLMHSREEDPVFHGAPAVIFITGKRNDEWSALDIGFCAQNLMLAAKSLGYDSCPVGFARMIEQTPAYHQLGIPADEQLQLAIVVGLGDETPDMPPRKKDVIVYL